MEIPEKITNEYLEHLPKIQINPTGDLICYARYDKQQNLVYILDNEGNFTGRIASAEKLVKNEPVKEPPKTEAKPEEPEPVAEEQPEEDTEKTETKRKPKWLMPVLIGVAVIVVIIVAVVLGKASLIVKSQTKETEPAVAVTQTENEPTTAEDPTTNAETPEENETVGILAVNQVLLPGHIIVAEDLSIVELEDIDYRLLAGVNGIYNEVDMENVVGLTVTSYLPAGSYLTYSVVETEYAPVSPWKITEDNQALVPLTIEVDQDGWGQYLWGTKASVKIEMQKKVTTDNESEEVLVNELPDGITYSNSVVESMVLDTYVIQSAIVADVLDAQGNSLFVNYSSLAEIPTGYLTNTLEQMYTTEESIAGLLPAKIVLALTEEEAAVISTLEADSIKVTMEEPVPEIQTEIQRDTYSKLQSIGAALVSLWNEIAVAE